MKVLYVNGEVIFDVANTAEAVELARALTNGKPKANSKPGKIILATSLQQTWEWLLANDRQHGMSVNEIAHGLGITASAAGARLKVLTHKELVHRPRRGHYRAGERAPA